MNVITLPKTKTPKYAEINHETGISIGVSVDPPVPFAAKTLSMSVRICDSSTKVVEATASMAASKLTARANFMASREMCGLGSLDPENT